MRELQEHLLQHIGTQKARASVNPSSLSRITSLMCEAWERAGLPFPQLRNLFCAVSSLTPEQRAGEAAAKLKRAVTRDTPLDWKVFTVQDLVREDFCYQGW